MHILRSYPFFDETVRCILISLTKNIGEFTYNLASRVKISGFILFESNISNSLLKRRLSGYPFDKRDFAASVPLIKQKTIVIINNKSRLFSNLIILQVY
jgi:hypothetical protein